MTFLPPGLTRSAPRLACHRLFVLGDAAAPPVAEATGAGGRVPPTGLSLADGERAMIERALSEANGNQTKAARLLGISRDTLRYRMAKSKITI